jgi:tRNA pseudouridine38-40 synthase
MGRHFLEISYDGTAYSGWQRQNNAQTVQGEIEKVLEILLRQPIQIMGSGRTDAGVHAIRQYAHADFPPDSFHTNELLKRCNGLLPRDIRITRIVALHADAHARFDAVARQYRYQLAMQSNIFDDRYTWVVNSNPDIEVLQRLATIIIGEHDFASFSKKSADVNHTRCVILHSEFAQLKSERIEYRIKANRFLHHMVRSLVGSMVKVASGRMEEAEFRHYLHSPNHEYLSFTAPAHALFLEDVLYPEGYLPHP